MPKFIHLRNHSSYSLAEGAIKIDNLVSLAKENKMPAVAITDTNNGFGWPEFSKTTLKAGIQPIIGTQINIPIELEERFDSFGKKLEPELGQIVLLVQNEKGYLNITKILSQVYTNSASGFTPSASWETLQEFNEGLICLSGGIKGVIGKNLSNNNFENTNVIAKKLNEIFTNRFYVEIQRHFLEPEEQLEPHFIKIATDLNIPLVATNECYFDKEEMYLAHDAFLCISQATFTDEIDRRKETTHHYFKSQEQMETLFEDLPEAIQNTVTIAQRCGFAVPNRPPLLPHAYDTTKYSEKEILEQQSRDGLKKRLEDLKLSEEDQKQYWERLDFELSVINNMGFPGYFLIVSDFIKWAKNRNIPVGPGRGSGAGSIVAWGLEITDLNPLQYGLLFERFLNPDRISMPDFDIDFCKDGREEVINYVKEKYGQDKVAQIISFGELQAKSAIRDVGRVMRIPHPVVDRIAKLIPAEANQSVTLKQAIEQSQELKDLKQNDENIALLLNYAEQLEGLYRQTGTHACGIVIGDRPLTELIPLYKDDRSQMPNTQFDVYSVEDTGLVKYDFLGLKTLSIMKQTIELIEKDGLKAPDINKLNLEDPKVYELFARGDTVGIFQFESRGMQEYLQKLQPTKFEELIAMNALYRPGPIENIPMFINRKHGVEKIEYPHPSLEGILSPTYGVIVYQEQVMQISQILANFSKGKADTVRKAMGKKIAKLMAELKIEFIEGAINNNIPKEEAESIWNLMEKFASYGFNKSHAACYAYIAYQTAYLKTHFRPYFMAATMNYEEDTDKLSMFFKDCKKNNLEVFPPDINKSNSEFKVEEGSIRYALGAIKNVGPEAMRQIVEERTKNGDFKDISDLINRIDYKSINKRMLENLIKAGAMDSLEQNRALLLNNVDVMINHARIKAQEQEADQVSLFGEISDSHDNNLMASFKKANKMTLSDQIKKEYEAIGFYITSHPIFSYEELLQKRKVLNSSFFKTTHENGNITVAAVIDTVFFKETKETKKPMAILSLSDMEGTFSALVFENLINRDMLKKDTPVIITGQLKKDGDSYTIFAKAIDFLENYFLVNTFHFILQLKDTDQVTKLNEILSEAKPGNAHITAKIATSAGIASLSLPKKYQITHELVTKLKKEKITVIMD